MTLTGGWFDKYNNAVTIDDKNKYTKRMLVLKMRDGLPFPVDPDDNEDKEFTILCCRYVDIILKANKMQTPTLHLFKACFVP